MPRLARAGVFLLITLWASGLAGCMDPENCDDIKRRAAALIEEFSSCGAADGCRIVDFGDVVPSSCLADFQCYTALSSDVDLEAFRRRAISLEEEFSVCGECAMAGCAQISEFRASCDQTIGRCVLVQAE